MYTEHDTAAAVAVVGTDVHTTLVHCCIFIEPSGGYNT